MTKFVKKKVNVLKVMQFLLLVSENQTKHFMIHSEACAPTSITCLPNSQLYEAWRESQSWWNSCLCRRLSDRLEKKNQDFNTFTKAESNTVPLFP